MTDARERLRAYLEQRRDLGERELVLDGMSVEEVLKIVGVPTQSAMAESDWRSVLGGNTASTPNVTPVNPAVTERAAAALSDQPQGPARPGRDTPEPARRQTESASSAPIDVPAGIIVGSSDRALFGGTVDGVQTLDEIGALTRACQACGLHKEAKNAVPGAGNPNADFVCVGEAPGQTEDETGLPFVGKAGDLLEKILLAIDLKRSDVFICNVIKHRPPGNRNPNPEEVAACTPFLRRQLELLQPKVILALGTFAAQTLLGTKIPISKLRGAIHRYYGVPLIATYHPAALLRNPSWKRPTWEDVQLARRILDRASGA